jgi:hypothetical protein
MGHRKLGTYEDWNAAPSIDISQYQIPPVTMTLKLTVRSVKNLWTKNGGNVWRRKICRRLRGVYCLH